MLALLILLLLGVFVHDRWFSSDNILRNYPVLGHLRYLLIAVGPKLRQYVVAADREEAPFNRDERDWVYRTALGENNYFGFGTDDQVYGIGYPVIKHAVFPFGDLAFTASIHDKVIDLPCAKVLGEAHRRTKAWRPPSVVNISAMSFGSLGANAVTAMNLGAKLAGCYHNTGEGGLAPCHRHGADLVFQLGTGYFGCRDGQGRFSRDKFLETVAGCPTVKGIEIKLSQGAKPGKGGVLPGVKVTEEIAAIRGVQPWRDCISPNSHSAFQDVRSLIRFVEDLAASTGLPVGVKSAVGHLGFWKELAQGMRETSQGPDWITIDGGEGGTGAAPLSFADHVSLPFRVGFPRVYKTFLDEGMAERVVWVGSAKLGFPDRAIVAVSLGCDLISIAREAMLAIGCIQAKICHTARCPAGITTHAPRYQYGLDPKVQSARLARFVQSFRNEILAVTNACGYEHPSQFSAGDIEVSSGPGLFTSLRELYGYTPPRRWQPIPGWNAGK